METACLLFGRSDTPQQLRQTLETALKQQLDTGVETFVLGQWGDFEPTALETLELLRKEYPALRFLRLNDCVLPDMENVPKRFAQKYAHRYLVERCGSVICCPHRSGNMQLLLSIARRRGISVVLLEDRTPPRA